MKPKNTKAKPKYFGKEHTTKSGHQHMVDQIKAKKNRPDQDRFIVQRIPNVGT